jgi:hypothetical protein
LKRIKLGHKPASLLDRISQAHDARYSLATTTEDVRKADEKFMQRIEAEKNKLVPVEYQIVKKAFEAKMGLEDHLKTKSRESVLQQNIEDNYTNADRQMMQGVLNDLIQKGEGRILPYIFILIKVERQVTDRQTDRQTDEQPATELSQAL